MACQVAFGKVTVLGIRRYFQSSFLVNRGISGEFFVSDTGIHDIQCVFVVGVVYGHRFERTVISRQRGVTVGISQNRCRVCGQFGRVFGNVIEVESRGAGIGQRVFGQSDHHIVAVPDQYHILFGRQPFDRHYFEIPYLNIYGDRDFGRRSAFRERSVQRSGCLEAVGKIRHGVGAVHSDRAFVYIPGQVIEQITSFECIYVAVFVGRIGNFERLIPLFGQQRDVFLFVEVHGIYFGHHCGEIVRSQHYRILNGDGYRDDVDVRDVAADISCGFFAFAGNEFYHRQIPIDVYALRIFGVAVGKVYRRAVRQYIADILYRVSVRRRIVIASDTARHACPSAAYGGEIHAVIRIVEYDLVGRHHRRQLHSGGTVRDRVLQTGEALHRTQADTVVGDIQFHKAVVFCGNYLHRLCIGSYSEILTVGRSRIAAFGGFVILYRLTVFIQQIAADVSVDPVFFVSVVAGFGRVDHQPGNIAVKEVLVVKVPVHVADVSLSDKLSGRDALIVGNVSIVADDYIRIRDVGRDPLFQHRFYRGVLVVQRQAVGTVQNGICPEFGACRHVIVRTQHRAGRSVTVSRSVQEQRDPVQ